MQMLERDGLLEAMSYLAKLDDPQNKACSFSQMVLALHSQYSELSHKSFKVFFTIPLTHFGSWSLTNQLEYNIDGYNLQTQMVITVNTISVEKWDRHNMRDDNSLQKVRLLDADLGLGENDDSDYCPDSEDMGECAM